MPSTAERPKDASRANSPTRWLAQAEQHWRDLDYELVVEAATRAQRAAGASRSERVRALRLQGSALVVLGRASKAEQAFRELLALDPDHELPEGTSPRVLSVFNPTRARWQVEREEALALALGAGLAGIRLTARLPSLARGGSPIVIPVELIDPRAHCRELVLAYRRRGETHYSTLATAARPGTSTLVIPGAVTASDSAYQLELHLRALHRSGVTLRRLGHATRPLVLEVGAGHPTRPRSVVKQWWFWTGVVTLVAAAVAIPVIVTQSRDVGPQVIVSRWQR